MPAQFLTSAEATKEFVAFGDRPPQRHIKGHLCRLFEREPWAAKLTLTARCQRPYNRHIQGQRIDFRRTR
jgi:hypothetical protein